MKINITIDTFKNEDSTNTLRINAFYEISADISEERSFNVTEDMPDDLVGAAREVSMRHLYNYIVHYLTGVETALRVSANLQDHVVTPKPETRLPKKREVKTRQKGQRSRRKT